MMQTLRGRLLAVSLLVAAAAPVSAQQPPSPPFGQPAPQPFVWWKSEVFKKDLALSADQIARIDKIWETTRLELRQEWDELSRLEDKFSRLLQNDAEEAMLSRQIDRVETARANTNKTRSLMLVQMRKVLSAEQRVRLDAIHARWLQDQRPPQAGPAPRPRDPQKKPED
jgi:Spy/CpxP family protein refolding chaperone